MVLLCLLGSPDLLCWCVLLRPLAELDSACPCNGLGPQITAVALLCGLVNDFGICLANGVSVLEGGSVDGRGGLVNVFRVLGLDNDAGVL